LCRQTLPEAIDEEALEIRLEELEEKAVRREEKHLRREAEREYRQKYQKLKASVRREAERDAKLRVKDELAKLKGALELRRQLNTTEKEHRAELKRERAAAEKKADKDVAAAQRATAKETQSELKAIRAEHAKDRARYQADIERYRRKVSELSLKLEKQSSQMLGDEAEVDLFDELSRKFPADRIERVRKGAKGADVVQHIMDGMEEVGRIVYESKNVSTWQSAFITKAKSYQTRYKTPYVVVVSRALPRREKGLCVRKGIPVVEPHMAIPLAAIVREAVAEIARMRVSGKARKEKEQVLFTYILSDDFGGRFRQIADGVKELRDLQDRARDWHDRTWDKESELHNEIDTGHRKISTKIGAITKGWSTRRKTRRTGAVA